MYLIGKETEEISMEETLIQTFEPAPGYQNRMSLFEQLPLNEKSIVFLGDSLSQRNEWKEMLDSDAVVNRGIDSDIVAGVYSRLHQISPYSVNKLFLMIGTNDLSNGVAPDEVFKMYEILVDEIIEQSPATSLYVQSIIPVNHTVYNHHMDNNDLVNFNARLKELCERKECIYINLYNFLKFQNTNELDTSYTYDGVHLSGEGYTIWVNKIRDYVME